MFATRPPASDPIRRLPTPAQCHAYIGHLLRELRIARRLYRLVEAARRHHERGER
jgi:hypothetical protein